ncbi:hypothetical protein [Pseudomonas sp. R3-52-08]|uniref:DUF6978 family protein n=1 Tax=Pseudomonas sp. R3-52-08 TaxID=1173284 RepID=UPI000F70EF9C|nr:hypothetical protein [Pseudomonas sp. R3-52-08]AZF22332.1 hypothetical protein C4J91_3589 [Pseudomonas sp. R3-52-08]
MVDTLLTDAQINDLLTCNKTISNPGARWKDMQSCKQKNYDVISDDGAEFEIYLRQNSRIAHSFSCGIFLKHPSGDTITLARYNGSCHPHQNLLEDGERIDFTPHIHRATERYMRAGRKPEHYAVATNAYTDLEGALWAMLQDCNISGLQKPVPPTIENGAVKGMTTQLSFFDE